MGFGSPCFLMKGNQREKHALFFTGTHLKSPNEQYFHAGTQLGAGAGEAGSGAGYGAETCTGYIC